MYAFLEHQVPVNILRISFNISIQLPSRDSKFEVKIIQECDLIFATFSNYKPYIKSIDGSLNFINYSTTIPTYIVSTQAMTTTKFVISSLVLLLSIVNSVLASKNGPICSSTSTSFNRDIFPQGFIFGAASAAFQVL